MGQDSLSTAGAPPFEMWRRFRKGTSASGTTGNGFGALLAFDLDGRFDGAFIEDDGIADPRGLAVGPQGNLLVSTVGPHTPHRGSPIHNKRKSLDTLPAVAIRSFASFA